MSPAASRASYSSRLMDCEPGWRKSAMRPRHRALPCRRAESGHHRPTRRPPAAPRPALRPCHECAAIPLPVGQRRTARQLHQHRRRTIERGKGRVHRETQRRPVRVQLPVEHGGVACLACLLVDGDVRADPGTPCRGQSVCATGQHSGCRFMPSPPQAFHRSAVGAPPRRGVACLMRTVRRIARLPAPRRV